MTDFLDMCRLCLENTSDLRDIFVSTCENESISDKIQKHLQQKILETDFLPKLICDVCTTKIQDFDSFYRMVETNQTRLHFLLDGEFLDEATVEVAVSEDYHTDEESNKDYEGNQEPEETEEYCEVITIDETDYNVHIETCPNSPKESHHKTDVDTKSESSELNEIISVEYLDDDSMVLEKLKEPTADHSSNVREDDVNYREIMKNGHLLITRKQLISRLHEFFDLTCTLCDESVKVKSFSKMYELLQHYTRIHDVKGYVVCCKKKLFNYKEMTMHYISHVEPKAFNCTFCSRKVVNALYMRQHVKCHTRYSSHIRCHLCNKRFISEHFLKVHINKIHQYPESSEPELELDQIEPHPDFPGFPKTIMRKGKLIVKGPVLMELMCRFFKFACELCDDSKDHTDLLTLFDHYKEVHQTPGYVTCCGTKFDVRRALQFHLASHLDPDVFKCSECGKQMNNPSRLRDHFQKHKPHNERPYFCPECPKRYSSRTGLDKHLVYHIPKEKRKKHICEECGKVFFTAGALKTHFRYSHLDQKLVCDKCGKQCKNKPILMVHIASHAKKSEEVGKSKGRRSEHIRSSMVWETQCNICHINLHEKTRLQRHMDQKHNGVIHKCEKCKYENPKWALFARHMRVQHSEKKFVCFECGRSFRYSFMLRDHIEVHAGHQKYTCEFCGKKYASLSGFCRHRRDTHAADYEELKIRKREERMKSRKKVKKREAKE